jgi:histone deacetylase 6
MLEEHLKEVQDLLLEKKSEYEEMNDVSSRTDDQVQATVRSPPLFSGPFTPNSRQESMTKATKSPILPPVGIFSMPSHSPKSPRSPLKKAY